jgi:hypothetical protein
MLSVLLFTSNKPGEKKIKQRERESKKQIPGMPEVEAWAWRRC